jgi:hypothetical protein
LVCVLVCLTFTSSITTVEPPPLPAHYMMEGHMVVVESRLGLCSRSENAEGYRIRAVVFES